jgi:HPt (histidine-containing phosphotransfer) domain-containing protein
VTTEPLLDHDHVESLLEFLAADKVRNLLASVVRGAPPLLNDMREAVDKSDPVGLHNAGHTAKGMFGNLGMRRCEAVSRAIESHGKAGEFLLASPLIAELETAVAETEAAMARWIDEKSKG